MNQQLQTSIVKELTHILLVLDNIDLRDHYVRERVYGLMNLLNCTKGITQDENTL